MMNLNPKNWKKYFRTPTKIRCFNISFLLRSSLTKADLFLTYKDGIFDIFIKKSKEIICGNIGMELYGSPKKYSKFMREFNEIISFGNKKFLPKYTKPIKNINKQEFKKAFDFVQKLWYYYGFLEFPYVDLAYETSLKNSNQIMKENVEKAGKFKFTPRRLLSACYFKDGAIGNLVNFIDKKYLESSGGAHFLYIEELLKVFEGWKPSKEIIKQRKICHSEAVINGKIIYFDYEKSLALNKKFTSVEERKIIKGVVVNKGRAVGKVIITPMLDDFKEIAKIDKKMKKGDILIAETTSPDIMMLCKKAGAIVADQGGMLSHAAIVSRELGIPGIVQAINATQLLKDGDQVEVNADKGTVKKL